MKAEDSAVKFRRPSSCFQPRLFLPDYEAETVLAMAAEEASVRAPATAPFRELP